MERDKRGRFVKKASTGTILDGGMFFIGSQAYKVRPGANKAYQFYKSEGGTDDFNTWITTFKDMYLATPGSQTANTEYVPGQNNINTSLPEFNINDPLGLKAKQEKNQQLDNFNTLYGNKEKTPWWAPEKTKVSLNGQQFVDESGAQVGSDVLMNQHRYDISLGQPNDPANDGTVQYDGSNSAGITVIPQNTKQTKKPWSINKTQLANWLDLTRAGIGIGVNNKLAERALAAEKPFLQDVSESHRSIYGDYRAKVEGEKAAAQLRNMAAQPLTSDGALQQQMMMEAQIKGQEYIDKGNAQDEALIKQTRETAWEQEKENQQLRQSTAMQNRQAMLMTQKNKADIENARDSANYSQIVSPYLTATEQRLREKGAEQEYWQDKYETALVEKQVWYDPNLQLTDVQKAIRDKYLLGNTEDLQAYLDEDKTRWTEYSKLRQIIDSEVLKRQAAIRGVNLTIPGVNTPTDPYAKWRTPEFPTRQKKGGTIYKARLSSKVRDNDRTAKSIESSKKIAARFLEKALDSLYTYNDVELIAKPKKKKRKYQGGGGIPFVGYTPTFATSQKGAPVAKEEITSAKGADLTNKDILELLKDIDGLPSDIDAIQASLSNFVLTSKLDPLGLDSTSSIASRYMSLIGKIKKAKANKEWYDKAYDKLRTDGSLNEYAIDSTGHFIGMNVEGDFERFTAQQVANGEVGAYQLLTNSNLLDIRARYPNAAFNSNLIMEAANGVSMQHVTEHISKVIQNLGSETTQTQIFGNQSKEVIAGLRQLQQAAQEIGQDLSISQLYEASVFNKTQAQQAQLALNYLYQTMPTNMKALLFAKAGSEQGALELVQTLVNSKLSSTYKLEFSPKTQGKASSKSGKTSSDGLELSPAQMLQQGYGERESILIQNSSSGGIHVDAITMPITTGSTGQPLGAATLEDVVTSQYGGLLNFNHASMGGQIIPFEGRRNIAIDGSKIYSMYLPIDQDELIKGNIVPDIDLIDKVNQVNKTIKQHNITDPKEINAKYEEAGLPVYLNEDGTVIPTLYRRFGVLNGTALDNAFGKDFVASSYLKEVDDEDIINGAISIMNKGRSKEDRIDYDPKSFFNFGGLLGDYDSIYQGTIFIPISNDVFLGIAGSGKTIDSEEALQLEALQQQHNRVSATYKNPGQLR